MTKAIDWSFIEYPEFDYQALLTCLKQYSHPRRKINGLLKTGDIVRVKKGLYVFGPSLQKAPASTMKLANLIYGPSYVSYETALAYYGFIPEAVPCVISSTPIRKKMFETPLGAFRYEKVSFSQFDSQFQVLDHGVNGTLLIATQEKALVEKMWRQRHKLSVTENDIEAYLFEDLRLDEELFRKLKLSRIKKLHRTFPHKSIGYLADYLEKVRK